MSQKGFYSPIIFIAIAITLIAGLYLYKSATKTPVISEVAVSPVPTPTPSPSIASFEPTEKGFKKYKNAKYEITLPETWLAQPITPGFGDYQSFANRAAVEAYDTSILGLSIRAEETEGDIKGMVSDGFNDPLKKIRDGDKATTTKIANLEINGLKTAKVFSTSVGKPTDSYNQMYYWIKTGNNSYYELQFGTTEDIKKYDAIMDQIVKSFRLSSNL